MDKLLKTMMGALLAMGTFISAPTAAHAALVDEPVPENAYITIGGYDVAWASPCAPVQPSCSVVDLSYQSQFGWEIMSSELFLELDIEANDFVVEGGNVDFATGNNLDEATGIFVGSPGSLPPQGDVALAIAYFNTIYYHADWSDGAEVGAFAPVFPADGAEALVVRVSGSTSDPVATPELGASGLTAALTLLGGSGVLLTDRRRRAGA